MKAVVSIDLPICKGPERSAWLCQMLRFEPHLKAASAQESPLPARISLRRTVTFAFGREPESQVMNSYFPRGTWQSCLRSCLAN